MIQLASDRARIELRHPRLWHSLLPKSSTPKPKQHNTCHTHKHGPLHPVICTHTHVHSGVPGHSPLPHVQLLLTTLVPATVGEGRRSRWPLAQGQGDTCLSPFWVLSTHGVITGPPLPQPFIESRGCLHSLSFLSLSLPELACRPLFQISHVLLIMKTILHHSTW